MSFVNDFYDFISCLVVPTFSVLFYCGFFSRLFLISHRLKLNRMSKINMKEICNECCLFNVLESCDTYIANSKWKHFITSSKILRNFFSGFGNWSSGLVNINDLNDDATSYLISIGVISKSNQVLYSISESQLILNRLARHIDIKKPYLKICMYQHKMPFLN